MSALHRASWGSAFCPPTCPTMLLGQSEKSPSGAPFTTSPTTLSPRQVSSGTALQSEDVPQIESGSRPHAFACSSPRIVKCYWLWHLEKVWGWKPHGEVGVDVGHFEVISLWWEVRHCGFFLSGLCCVHQRERALHSHPQDDRRREGVRNYRTRLECVKN